MLVGVAAFDDNGIEERIMADGQARRVHGTVRQHARLQRDSAGNPPEPLRPVPDGVEAGNDRQQDLRRADVGRGFFPPDVLLARLQRQAQRRLARGVEGDTDQSVPAEHA